MVYFRFDTVVVLKLFEAVFKKKSMLHYVIKTKQLTCPDVP